MLNAILKLLEITTTVLILVAGIVFFARVNGLRQHPQTPPHAWFERQTWDLRAPAPDDLCAHPPVPHPGWIYVLPVRKTPTTWQVTCAAGTSLADFLKATTHVDWLIDVEAGAGEDLDNFVDIVNNSGVRRVGIHADSQRAARALRKKMPGWIYAADDASMLRLRMFTNIFLGPAVDFWPDFALAGSNQRNELGEAEVAELHRRGKRVIWIEDATPPFAVDGVLTKRLNK